jgi:CDP-diglyceride synthetase
MTQLAFIAIILGLSIGYLVAKPKIAGKRAIEIKLITCFLLGQLAYLLLILFDNEKGSEIWQFLALTYIPLTVILFIVLLIVTIKNAKNIKGFISYIYSFGFLALYLIGAYFVLYIWGWSFNFPL